MFRQTVLLDLQIKAQLLRWRMDISTNQGALLKSKTHFSTQVINLVMDEWPEFCP